MRPTGDLTERMAKEQKTVQRVRERGVHLIYSTQIKYTIKQGKNTKINT